MVRDGEVCKCWGFGVEGEKGVIEVDMSGVEVESLGGCKR